MSKSNQLKIHDLVLNEGNYYVITGKDANHIERFELEKLELTGCTTGWQGVSRDICELKPAKDAPRQWIAAYTVWKGNQLVYEYQLEQQALSNSNKDKIIELVSLKHNIDSNFLKEILKDLKEAGVI